MNEPPSPVRRSADRRWRQLLRVLTRTASKAWDDSIFSMSAQAAFWQTLSLPPLLLGVLGSLGYVGGWFGPDTLPTIQTKIISFSNRVFSPNVVSEIISPTVSDVLQQGRGDVMSLGFLLSLWAGSSAVSSFVDSIVEAHGQTELRHPVRQRLFALMLYVVFLVLVIFALPVIALGPKLIGRLLPSSWYGAGAVAMQYGYPAAVSFVLLLALTTLYRVALPRPLPWHRLLIGSAVAGVFFLIASWVLRFYLTWVTSTGYTYGALATPIAFLLFTFFLGFAVVLGAELNAAIQEQWPARATRTEQMREWLRAQAALAETDPDRPVTAQIAKFATGPIRTRQPKD